MYCQQMMRLRRAYCLQMTVFVAVMLLALPTFGITEGFQWCSGHAQNAGRERSWILPSCRSFRHPHTRH